jgi:hypothetical protein
MFTLETREERNRTINSPPENPVIQKLVISVRSKYFLNVLFDALDATHVFQSAQLTRLTARVASSMSAIGPHEPMTMPLGETALWLWLRPRPDRIRVAHARSRSALWRGCRGGLHGGACPAAARARHAWCAGETCGSSARRSGARARCGRWARVHERGELWEVRVEGVWDVRR